MFLVGVGLGLYIFGFMIYFFTWLFPELRIVFMDWVALIIMVVPWVITLYRVKTTRCWYQVDKLPMWKHLIKYLRRDNEMVELLGERAYPGESFIDVKELGLIEFLGKDCFYSCGDKKFVWGLENINFTPDPRYMNFNHLLYSLGFNDSDDVKNVLNGTDLELMGIVYLKMLDYDESHGVTKLVKELRDYDGGRVVFNKNISHEEARGFVDKIPRVRVDTSRFRRYK